MCTKVLRKYLPTLKLSEQLLEKNRTYEQYLAKKEQNSTACTVL